MIEPGKPEKLTAGELVEALEIAASRIRMAAPADFRHVGDVIAGLALEAAARLRAGDVGGVLARVVTFSAPVDHHGDVYAPGSLKGARVPLLEAFDEQNPIGVASILEDGTARLWLRPGLAVNLEKIAKLSPINVGLGFRVIRSHVDDGVRVIDELEPLCVGIDRRVLEGLDDAG